MDITLTDLTPEDRQIFRRSRGARLMHIEELLTTIRASYSDIITEREWTERRIRYVHQQGRSQDWLAIY